MCGEGDSKGNFLSHGRRIDRDCLHTWRLRAGSQLTQMDKRASHNKHLDSVHKDRRLCYDRELQAFCPKNILRARRKGMGAPLLSPRRPLETKSWLAKGFHRIFSLVIVILVFRQYLTLLPWLTWKALCSPHGL